MFPVGSGSVEKHSKTRPGALHSVCPGTVSAPLTGYPDVFSSTDHLIKRDTIVVPEKNITTVCFKILSMLRFSHHSTFLNFLTSVVVRTLLNDPHNTESKMYPLFTPHRQDFTYLATGSSVQFILQFCILLA
jgi:hypothetical protein